MQPDERSPLVEALAEVPDPRRQGRNLRHRLVDVLALGFCGVPGGREDFAEVEAFARSKEDFSRRFLGLPHGIPSHDTFRRVFRAVCPRALQACLLRWPRGARRAADGAVVAVDGKTLRRTSDRARGPGALHLVSAWASANGLTLGQVAVGAGSNETAAIPELIELLDLSGCAVAIDAAGCQKDVAAQLVAGGADSVPALKDSHPAPHGQVADYFPGQLEAGEPDRGVRHQRRVERGHGRAEARET